MSFQDAAPEPKKLFLNLLINLDFQVAHSLYRFKNFGDAINGIAEILAIIGAKKTEDLKDLFTRNQSYLQSGTAPIEELQSDFYELQQYLMSKWFSELKLGIVPVSTIKGDKEKPASTPLDPKQTSRI